LFQRLAVVAEGCTVETTDAVCEPQPDALDGLPGKSLLQRRAYTPNRGVGMLESIRDFAAGRLTRADEALELRARHAGYFQTFANRMDLAPPRRAQGGARS
jgi:hypothetical protein